VIGWFGNDPEQSNSALCLDLRHDLDQVAAMDQAKLEAFLDKSPKPLRRLGTNRAPHICTLAEAPLGCLGGLAIEEAEARANRLKEDAGLRDRLVAAALATKTKYETSAHIEEQLYERFVGRADEVRMSRFHEVPWAARGKIVESFEDDRLRYFGRRLLQYHAPQQLLPEHKAELEALTAARLLEQAVPKDKWTSLPMALQATDEELKTAEGEAAAILAEYRAHLSVRLEQLGKGSQRAAGEHGR
jgi:exodeoxyribonuclease-1